MRAAVLPAFDRALEIRDIADPVPGVGEVLVEVAACGAGLTLEVIRKGRMGGEPPFIMGHEFAGRIAALGTGVDVWKVGDRVTATFYLTCGRCRWCASGLETLCENFEGYIGAARDGAFAERIVVPARNLVLVPDEVPLDIAGIVADAIATPYHVAADRLKIKAGQRIAVLGAGGGLGVHMLAMIRAFGGTAIGVERERDKLAELERRGLADAIIDAGEDGWEKELTAAAKQQLDGFVDTVCSTETLAAGARVLGRRGALVLLGVTAKAEVNAEALKMLTSESAIMGTRYCNRAEIAASLDLVATGRVRPIIGRHYPLDAVGEAFEAIQGNKLFGRAVIDIGAKVEEDAA